MNITLLFLYFFHGISKYLNRISSPIGSNQEYTNTDENLEDETPPADNSNLDDSIKDIDDTIPNVSDDIDKNSILFLKFG